MNLRKPIAAVALGGVAATVAAGAQAQLRDTKEKISGNDINEGIQRNLAEQVGAGRGDVLTHTSSMFVIKRDPFRAIRRGRQIFQRKFLDTQGFSGRDRSGNINDDPAIGAGIVDSCAGCHGRPRGSAGVGGNVFTRPDSRDAPHLFGLGLHEMLGDEITSDLRAIQDEALDAAESSGNAETRQLTSKGVSYGSITAFPDGSVDVSDVEGVNPDLRVRPFFAQGGTISIREFVVGAFNAEMGLQSDDPDLRAAALEGERVVTPAGMVLDGALDAIEAPPVTGSNGLDPDGDGKSNEIPQALVDFTEFYLLNYFKPGTNIPPDKSSEINNGRALFNQIGCTSCHVSNLTIERDRRVADVETVFSATESNPFHDLVATAIPLFVEEDDGSANPTLKLPANETFVVQNFFADLKRHDLGPNFWELNFDGSLQREMITEPLWGVGSTAPYGHDGRSPSLEEVILRHGGEAQASRNAFASLSRANKNFVLSFLDSLVLFPPDDTPSNLNPIDPGAPSYPQNGHGSIALGVLFNDPGQQPE